MVSRSKWLVGSSSSSRSGSETSARASARKRAHLRFGWQTQSCEHDIDTLMKRPAVNGLEPRLQRRHAVHIWVWVIDEVLIFRQQLARFG